MREWPRPTRTASRPEAGPLPWDTPHGGAPDDTEVRWPRLYLHGDVVVSMDRRSRQGVQQRHEDLGLLLGDWALDPEGRPFAVAMDMVSGSLSASPVSVRFTEEGLGQVARELDELDYPYVIVGWYHTHLDLGCFMSDRDRATQRGGFPHVHQVAVVVDPIRGQAAAFANGEGGPGTVMATMASYGMWEAEPPGGR